jgi:hypothetical protein
MINYLKKLFSGQYKHCFKQWHRYYPNLSKCEKCGKWKPYFFPELDLCPMSENEYIIKQIIE